MFTRHVTLGVSVLLVISGFSRTSYSAQMDLEDIRAIVQAAKQQVESVSYTAATKLLIPVGVADNKTEFYTESVATWIEDSDGRVIHEVQGGGIFEGGPFEADHKKTTYYDLETIASEHAVAGGGKTVVLKNAERGRSELGKNLFYYSFHRLEAYLSEVLDGTGTATVEDVPESSLLVVTFERTDPHDEIVRRYRVWMDPARSCFVPKWEIEHETREGERYISRRVEVTQDREVLPGVWFPMEGKAYCCLTGPEEVFDLDSPSSQIRVLKVQVNVDLGDLNFSPGDSLISRNGNRAFSLRDTRFGRDLSYYIPQERAFLPE